MTGGAGRVVVFNYIGFIMSLKILKQLLLHILIHRVRLLQGQLSE
eukprot:COSAG06_NODE_14492_length_1152_cov_0.986705_2_plen_44_part_01